MGSVTTTSLESFRLKLALSDAGLLQDKGLVGGKWVSALSGEVFTIEDPSIGELLCSVPEMDEKDASMAVAEAEKAFASFSKTTARSRARILYKLNEEILRNKEDIAKIIVAENGKPEQEGLAEVIYAASFIEWFAGEAERTYGHTIPAANPNSRIMTIKQPIGVVAALCPWNLPLAMATRKVGAAIAAGCTCVVKPAGETPFSTLAMGVLLARSGVPDGVVNIITTLKNTAQIGAFCCEDPRIKKISLTGSTRVGKLLVRQSADTLKKLSLELGGNAPVLVFADANLQKAVQGILVSKLRNGGQTCVAANRVLVQKDILPELVKLLQERIHSMKVGGGSDPNVTIGPLISQRAVKKVEEHIDDALKHGAKVEWTYPNPIVDAAFSKGFFYPPTILTGLNHEMLTWHEETFGPLVAIHTFESEEEAVRLANETTVGLGSYIFTQDISRAMRLAEQIRAGLVGINTGMLSACESPFGGVEQSGYGKEGSYMGIDEYMITKAINIDVS